MYPASLKSQENRKPKRIPHISVSLAENNERAEDRKREKRRNKPQPKQTATPSEGTCTSRVFTTATEQRAPPFERQIWVCRAECAGQNLSIAHVAVGSRAWGGRQKGKKERKRGVFAGLEPAALRNLDGLGRSELVALSFRFSRKTDPYRHRKKKA